MGQPVFEREAAVAAIEATLDAARSGHGGALFLLGEAGLGKTTMLLSARTLAGPAFATGVGHGDAVEATLPFGIFSQALDGLGSRAALDAGSSPVMSGTNVRATRFYTVLRYLEGKSTEPVLLLLDDLHWADPDSLGLVSFLCRRISALPIALVGALRPWPPGVYDMVQRLAASGDARLERLKPLSDAAAVALLKERVGPNFYDQIFRARSLSSGNPLLLEQLALLIARGDSGPEANPATFESDLLRARFAGGTPSELRYADAASVFGTAFYPALAAELAGLPGHEADAALEGLCASDVVRALGAGLAAFTHPLLRQTLYERIPAPVRAQKHAAAFRLLVAHGAASAEAADQAMLAELSGDAQAIAVLERAGREAQEAGALASARQRYEAAARLAGSNASPGLLLELAQVLLASADAKATARVCRRLLAMDELAEADRMAGRRILGRALFIGGDPQAAQREFQQAVDDSVGSAPAEAVETLLEAVYVSWPTGGAALATPLAARARTLARDLPDDLRSRAETAWAFCTFVGGDPTGVRVIEQSARRAEAEPASDIGTFAWTWGALGLHGNVAKWMERFDEAERAFKIGMATAERLNLPVAIASLAVMHGDTCARTGRLEEGLRLVDRASALAELAPERAFWAAVAHCYILIEMGRLDEARSWAQTARSLAEPLENWPGWLWLWHIDAQLALQARRRDEACVLFERIEALADQAGILEPCVVTWMGDAMGAYAATGRLEDADRILRRLEASVRALPCRIPRVAVALAHAARFDLMGERRQAETAYEEAMALSRALPAPPLQARVLLRYGVFLRRRGELVQARRPFAEALELAESVQAETLASRAADELAGVGGRRHRRREDPDALTAAEARVASLAHEGLSDREIADRLTLSINTIETHLQRVYRKLGITSRRELMRRPALPMATETAAPGTSAARPRTSAAPGAAQARSSRQAK